MLLEQIKKDQIKARKSFSRTTETGQMHIKALTTLLGEASPSGNSVVTDEDVQKVVRKFVKNLDETIKDIQNRSIKTDGLVISLEHDKMNLLLKERALYTSYLPQVFGEDKIKVIIDSMEGANKGQIMGACKKAAADAGLMFDGKMVNKVLG